MIDPNTLFESIVLAKQNIPAINKLDVVATDDEFVEILGEFKTSDNILLVAVLPSYGGFGEEDNSGMISYLQFFVMEKTDLKMLKNRDEYRAIFQRTLATTRDFVREMFGINVLNCSVQSLQYDFQIRPVARKAQCHGYEIQIDSKAYTDFN